MNIKLQVITNLPDVKDWQRYNGQLYDDLMIKEKDRDTNKYYYRPLDVTEYPSKEQVKTKQVVECRLPVVEIGEILIIDADTGRELNPPQRMADKWDVEYEIFDVEDVQKAISCGIKARQNYFDKIKEAK